MSPALRCRTRCGRLPPIASRHRSRGLGTVALCAVLLLMMGGAAVWAVRALTVAQRVAANDWRGAQAAEAAESGLAWGVAMMNAATLAGLCPPVGTGAAVTSSARNFRERFLRTDEGGFPRIKSNPAAPNAWIAACVNAGALQWTCACDPDSLAGLAADAPTGADAARPMFSLRLADTDAGGQFRLTVRGCSQRSPECESGAEGPMGQAELLQHIALLSAVRLPPSQPITEGPGAFRAVFGMPPELYRQQPALTRLTCDSSCDSRIAQALGAGRRLLWIDGDASLVDASLRPDTGVEPFVLIVMGKLVLQASGAVTGLVYARDGIHFQSPPGQSARWRGALVTDADWRSDGTVTIDHDPAVLLRLSRQLGSYLPAPGGWSPAK